MKSLLRIGQRSGSDGARPAARPGTSGEHRGGNLMTDGELPRRAQSATELRALLDRGVRLKYVYTGGQPRYYNYRDQFRDAFPSVRPADPVDIDFYQDADHTLTLLHQQRRLAEQICAWAVRARWTGTNPDRVIPVEHLTTHSAFR